MKSVFSLLLVFCLPGLGASYYVDNVGGSDAAAGTAQGSAWQHAPGDSDATGTPAAANINGDTIYFKGGLYTLANEDGIVISSARYNVQNGVSLLSGDAIGWGTGRAIIDGGGIGVHLFQFSQMTNVLCRGFECRNTVGADGNAAVYVYRATSNYFDGLFIHDCGTNDAGAHQDGIEITDGGGYNTITNCWSFNTTQKGIEIHGPDNTHNLIVDCVVSNNTDHGITISSSFNTVLRNTVKDSALRNVWLYAKTDPGYAIKLSSADSTSVCCSNRVFLNVAMHNNGSCILDNVGAVDMDGNLIFNNTFIDCGYVNSSASATIAFGESSSGRINHTQYRNNLNFGTVNTSFITGLRLVDTALGNSNFVSHCLWGNTNSIMKAMINVAGTQEPTFANFADDGSTSPDNRFCRSGHGAANSFGSSANQIFNSNPLLTSYPLVATLSASSPARGAGTNLSAYFTTDKDGNAMGSSWPIGAYNNEASPDLSFPAGIKRMARTRTK